jgi:hypothetical protein
MDFLSIKTHGLVISRVFFVVPFSVGCNLGAMGITPQTLDCPLAVRLLLACLVSGVRKRLS